VERQHVSPPARQRSVLLLARSYSQGGNKIRYIPQARHASAPNLMPTLLPIVGVTTPGPSSITSPTPFRDKESEPPF
jgi:hypothetical protein